MNTGFRMRPWGGKASCAAALLVALLVVLTPAAAHAATATEKTTTTPPLAPCRVAGIRHDVLCGELTRALDPANPASLRFKLHYVVVPALARRKLDDPVLFIAGGPGQSATAVAGGVLPLFARLNNRRDIVFIDQRGTGRSAPLRCDDVPEQRSVSEQADPELQFQALVHCRDRLAALPHVGGRDGLKFFTTTLAVQDFDAVRDALGATRVNLVGGSYGTRVALEYQRQFPTRVRRSVLDGVAPPDMVLPESVSTDAQAVFDALLNACAREAACSRRHPKLRADWTRLLASLPKTVTVAHPLGGVPETFVLTRDMVLGAVRGVLYAPSLASALPSALAEAAAGRPQGLLGLNAMLSGRGPTAPAMGMHFSVTCAEDVPRLGAGKDRPGSDFGDAPSKLYQRVCAQWPRGEVPAAFYTVSPSASPVLLLSGGLDPATPPRHAARVAQSLGQQALAVTVENAGHGVMSIGCTPDVLYRFIAADDNAAALALDSGCMQSVPRPPMFAPLALPAGDSP